MAGTGYRPAIAILRLGMTTIPFSDSQVESDVNSKWWRLATRTEHQLFLMHASQPVNQSNGL